MERDSRVVADVVKKQIAFVTSSLTTSILGFAECLVRGEHAVSICFLVTDSSQLKRIDHWIEVYKGKKIQLIPILASENPIQASPAACSSYVVYEFLRDFAFERRWDVIHFTGRSGLGFYTLQAKRTLGLFVDTVITTIADRSPSSENSSIDELASNYLEASSIKNSDVVLAPLVVLPETNLPPYSGRRRTFNEIVFFGRLEKRSGLDQFVEAVARLGVLFFAGKRVVFLGSIGEIEGRPANHFISQKLSAFGIEFEILEGLESRSALEYLSRRHPLVVLSNAPGTSEVSLHECLAIGFPVIAPRVEAFETAVPESYRERILFGPDSKSLADKIAACDLGGVEKVPSRIDQKQAREDWLEWHRSPSSPKTPAKSSTAIPLVSVCIPHRNRPEFLEAALASLEEQTYADIEILIGDDASDFSEEARRTLSGLAAKPSRFPRSLTFFETPRGPGAVRNDLARAAKGEFVFFMDDDNLARAHEIATLVEAQGRTRADIVTCPYEKSRHGKIVGRWIPIGAACDVGYFVNVFGDTNALIRKSMFLGVGGFETMPNFGGEDWEFFMRAVMKGFALEVVPEVLVTYREHADNYSKRIDSRQSRQLFLESFLRLADKSLLADVLRVADGDNRSWQERQLPTRDARESSEALRLKVLRRFEASAFVKDTRTNASLKLEVLDDVIYAKMTDEDAHLVVLDLGVAAGRPVVLRVAFRASIKSIFCVYFLRAGETEYSEANCLRQVYFPGETQIEFELAGDVKGPLRLDPSDQAGTIIISSLELLAPVETEY